MPLSAAFTVNGDANPNRHEAAYAATVNLALASIDGVGAVEWSIVGTSKSGQTVPTITLGGVPLGSTASFSMPTDPSDGLGRAFRVKCRVSNGYAAAETYGVVGSLNDQGRLPLCVGEQLDRDATHGITDDINEALNGGVVGGVVTGSGTLGQYAVWDSANVLTSLTPPNIGNILANGNNADGDRITNLLDPVDDQDADTKGARDAAIAALDATDIAWDDTNSALGASNVQEAIDQAVVYVNLNAEGQVVGQSGTPAYASGYSVTRLRTQDGALITRLSSNVYKANITKSVTHNAATAKELATVYMEANTTAVIGVVIHATETGTPTVRANLRFHLDVQCEADNDMVKIDGLSTWDQPDALPLTSVPDWVGASYAAFNSLVTIDLATDNYVKIKVTPANTDTVRWTIDVDATITEL